MICFAYRKIKIDCLRQITSDRTYSLLDQVDTDDQLYGLGLKIFFYLIIIEFIFYV